LAAAADLGEWGHQEITHNDIIIPRLLCVQGMSSMATKGDGKIGDIRESMNESLVGGVGKPVEIIPFKLERVWKEVDAKDKKTIKAVYPVISDATDKNYNEDLKNEVVDSNGQVVAYRFRTMQFYALLPGVSPLPHMLEFKSTSLRAGKKIATQMYTTNRMEGKSPAAKVFNLSTIKEEKDKQVYAVFDVSVGRDATAEEQENALMWFKTLRAGQAKVHETQE